MTARTLLVSLALPAALAPASAGAPLLTTAEEVLAAHIEATGGAAAYAGIETRWESGSIEFAGHGGPADFTSTYVAFSEAPDRQMTQSIVDGVMSFRYVSDGTAYWRETDTGAELTVGEEHDYHRRWSALDRLYRWRQLYARAELTGVEEVENERPCYRVALHPARGEPEVHFFDLGSALLVRLEEVVPVDAEKTDMVSTYHDWQETGGILLPRRIVSRTPDREFRRTVREVRQNIAIPEGTFDPPAEVRDQLAQVGDPGSVSALPEPDVSPVDPGTVTSEPVNVWKTEPVYPPHALLLGIEGRVVLRAVITRHGKVTRIETERAPLLDLGFTAAARETVAGWRYAPATLDGEAVDVSYTLVVDFRLDG